MLSQVQNEVINRYRDKYNKSFDKYFNMNNIKDFELTKKEYLNNLRKDFLKETFEEYDLNIKKVSEYKFDEFKIENILLNSPLGMQVNITVFSPIKEGKYPGVLELTGSSRKLNRHYWASAQTIAKAGYIVVACDVIGFVGERAEKNDTFYDAPLGYLVGYGHLNSFLSDIKACLDYLDTRDDVLSSLGYCSTGVSLGGTLSIEAAMHDDRIKILAPVCCAMDMSDKFDPFFSINIMQYNKDSMVDITMRLALCAPKKCLFIAGAKDEKFTPATTKKVFNNVKTSYDLYGKEDLFELFIDQKVGHLYSIDMANEVIYRLNKFFKNLDYKPNYSDSDVIEIDEEKMKGYPNHDITVYSIIKDRYEYFLNNRSDLTYKYLKEKASEILNIDKIEKVIKTNSEGEKTVITHIYERFDMLLNDKIKIPSILIKRDNKIRRGLIVVDEFGMWNKIKKNGLTAKIVGSMVRVNDINEPCILSVDISTCGENKLNYSCTDVLAWSNNETALAYYSFALNKPTLGLMTRDILASIKYIRSLENIDENNISLIGIGKGAIATLHATLIDGNIKNLELIDMIDGYYQFFEQYPYKLKLEYMIPDILKYYDLPDIIKILKNTTNIEIT